MKIMTGVLALAILVSSCSWLPNSTLRIALPNQPDVQQLWNEIARSWHETHSEAIELVPPGSFPPADLIWTDTNDDESIAIGDQAFRPNARVEAAATNLGPGWITESPLLPLRWSPWTWWTSSSLQGTDDLIPSDDSLGIAGLVSSQSNEPSFAAGPRERQTQGPTRAEAIARVTEGRARSVWLSFLDADGTDLVPRQKVLGEGKPIPTRIQGLFWSSQGWNSERVPDFLSFVWSTEIQGKLGQTSGWLPVLRSTPARSAAVETLQRRIPNPPQFVVP